MSEPEAASKQPTALLLNHTEQQYVVIMTHADTLRDAGWQVTERKLAEAISITHECDIIIVLGLSPQVAEGVLMLDTLRQQYPDTPIALVTGHHADDVLRLVEEHGVVGCLSRPCSEMQFLEMAYHALRHKKANRPV